MRKILIILLATLCWGMSMKAQDSTFNRVVTVERDYQPDIEQATKIKLRPVILKEEVEPNPVIYSTYSTPLSVEYNLHPLQAAKASFTPQPTLNGVIEGAVGHRNSHLLFGYRINHKKKMSLDLYANHDAYWGKDALSNSKLGMQVSRHFSGADLYFGVEGGNESYAYRPTFDWRTIWNINAKLGLQSTNQSALQYRIQTGYNAFTISALAFEHSVRSHLDLWWTNQQHSAGIKAFVQNNFYTTSQTGVTLPSDRHNIRVEPFYEYKGKQIRVHAGVNIDLNIGTGQLLSNAENISFAPSPNVQFEWNMMNNIFHLYANATGQYGLGSWEEYIGYNRYLNESVGLKWNVPRAYTPVDAQVGFKIRPTKTLLIDIYGGYAYMIGACNMHAEERYDHEGLAFYNLWQSDYQRWKVGTNIHYHYRDILELNVGGNYYFYQQEPIPSMDPDSPNFQENRIKGTHIFDRPNWDIYARIDAHIDSKWSVYSENQFVGSRWAYVMKYPDGASAEKLRPTISLNVGGQYSVNNWLHVYLQLNNYLNRKNDIFYGYQSQGCHFLLGVKYKF